MYSNNEPDLINPRHPLRKEFRKQRLRILLSLIAAAVIIHFSTDLLSASDDVSVLAGAFLAIFGGSAVIVQGFKVLDAFAEHFR